MPQITILLEGQSQEFAIDYLSQDSFDYWRAWLEQRAYALFAQSLGVPALQLVLGHVPETQTPKLFRMEAACCRDSVILLLRLFTGRQLIPDDPQQAFVTLSPFIRKVEREVSWDEANRIRAAKGKPPIGKASNGKA
jgi:hypothetical protein